MESRTKILGHAIHPMLVVFPLAMFATAVVFDLIRIAGGGGTWGVAAYYDIAVGVIVGLVAAVFGFVDWLAVPRGTRARSVGLWHGLGNLLVQVLFIISWLLRAPDPKSPSMLAFALSAAGVVLVVITAWLGGELVERLRVGVDDGANLDAANSLTGRAGSSRGTPG